MNDPGLDGPVKEAAQANDGGYRDLFEYAAEEDQRYLDSRCQQPSTTN